VLKTIENATRCNELQLLLQTGQYQAVLDGFALLKSPTATEMRLAGKAHWGLGGLNQATILLKAAELAGEAGASIDLIYIYIAQNQISQAELLHESLKTRHFTPKDTVQYQMAGGEIALHQNRLSTAQRFLNQAWVEAHSLGEQNTLVQSIAASLSAAYYLSGDGLNALKYIDIALTGANDFWKSYLQLNKAEILFFSGNIVDSKAILGQVSNLVSKNPQLKTFINTFFALSTYHESEEKSVSLLSESINDSIIKNENTHYIFTARAFLIGMLIHTNQLDQARGHLAKLEIQAQTPNEIATYSMRRGQYLTANGQFEKASIFLKNAHQIFYDLEWRRELGWTLLHLANCEVRAGNAHDAREYLDLLGDVMNVIEGAAFLELERRFIGDLEPLQAIASSYGVQVLNIKSAVLHKPLENRPAPRGVRLRALGEPILQVNGLPTPVKLTKGYEIIAYLLLYPHSSIEKIIADIFENSKDMDAAKSYFHTARYQIMAACPYIKFPYNKITRTYSLDTSEFDIDFDYNDVAQLLHAPSENEFYQALELCKGEFLQGFEGQWIEEVRANMEWLLVRSGLKLVQEMYETGDFQACRRLTERLLKIEPFDESLNEVLVRATKEIEGALASRKAMSKVESQFLSEVGELPPTLAQLKKEIKYRMN
jgi:DNA-binding SARP family transcriptional activator